MPYGYKRKRRGYGYRRTKKTYRRSRSKYSRKRWSKASRSRIHGLASSDEVFVKLRFVEEQYGISASIPFQEKYTGNDIYDPRVASGGTTALGMAAWSAQYTKWIVYGSKCKITWVSDLSNSQGWVGLGPFTSSATVVDFGMQKYVQNKIMSSRDGSHSVVNTKAYMSTKKLLGAPDISQIKDYWGSANASPATRWYWYLNYDPITPTMAGNWGFKVEITYYVKFFDRQRLVA